MYSCDWYKGGLWRYAHNLSLQLLKLDQKNQYNLIHGVLKPENFNYLHSHEIILPLKNYQKVLFLPNYLKLKGYDVVHQTENFCPLFSNKQRYRKIITIHDLTPYKFPDFFSRTDYFYYRYYLPKALERVDCIIVPSNSTKNDLVNLYQLDPGKIRVIYEGIEENFFERIDSQKIKEFLSKNGVVKPYLMTVGMNYHRNLPTIFSAFAALRSDLRNSLELVIIDAAGIAMKRASAKFVGRGTLNIMKSAEQLGILESIKIIGGATDEELRMAYQGATAFVFPSLAEGFGFPPLEALASGCPVLSSNVSAMPETLSDAAVLLDPVDVEQWKIAIEKAISVSPDRGVIERGLKIARKFNWKTCAEEHIKVYYD